MLKHIVSKSALLAFACSASICMPALADERRQIDVPAGELIAALKTLAQQGGVDLIYRSEQLEGLSTQGVSGLLSPQEAVRRLLEGTALTVKTDSSGAMLIALPRSVPTSGSTPSSAPKPPSAGAPLSAAATAQSRQTSVQQPAAQPGDATVASEAGNAAPVEHVRTQNESASPAAHPSSGGDIEGGLARVNTARASADADPLALEEALSALGDAYLKANQYAPAEAAYAEAVRSAEQHGGRETQRVLAPLTGLGTTFARAGHHHDAIPLLQRAVAITRAQFGMFDLRQQDVLETLAGSLTALDRQPEAQDLMIYRVRAAEKTYGEGSPKVIPWLCDLGNWFADIGKTPEARMTFQVALNIVGTTDSLNAPIIVEPLRGIARAYMLRSSYPDNWRKPRWPTLGCGIPYAVVPPECLNPAALDSMGYFIIEPRTLNQEGEEALKRALRILDSDPGSTAQTRIETLIQMGDWYQIKKSPREALTYYERAWQLIRATPRLPDSAATALNVPVRVYYPTPQIVAHVPTLAAAVDTRSNYVETEFTVAADGSVRDARIVGHDTRDLWARDVLKAVRDSRFRPKFVDGQAVAATGITYREVFWTGKPRD